MKTFIVRIQQDAGGIQADAETPRLRGVVDEVATGLRTTFRNDRELVTALIAAVSAESPGPPRDTDRRAQSAPPPDRRK